MKRKTDFYHLTMFIIAMALVACTPRSEVEMEQATRTETATTLGDDLRGETSVGVYEAGTQDNSNWSGDSFLERAIRVIPDDTQESVSYYSNPVAVASNYDGNYGELSMDGYVIFSDYDCSINDQEPTKFIDCTYGRMGYMRDDELVGQLPTVLNIDVFKDGWTCTSICVDSENNLVGAVSPPMLRWLKTRCENHRFGQGRWYCDL